MNNKHSLLSTSDIKSFVYLQYLLNIDLTKNCCKNVFGGRTCNYSEEIRKVSLQKTSMILDKTVKKEK